MCGDQASSPRHAPLPPPAHSLGMPQVSASQSRQPTISFSMLRLSCLSRGVAHAGGERRESRRGGACRDTGMQSPMRLQQSSRQGGCTVWLPDKPAPGAPDRGRTGASWCGLRSAGSTWAAWAVAAVSTQCRRVVARHAHGTTKPAPRSDRKGGMCAVVWPAMRRLRGLTS